MSSDNTELALRGRGRLLFRNPLPGWEPAATCEAPADLAGVPLCWRRARTMVTFIALSGAARSAEEVLRSRHQAAVDGAKEVVEVPLDPLPFEGGVRLARWISYPAPNGVEVVYALLGMPCEIGLIASGWSSTEQAYAKIRDFVAYVRFSR